MSTAFKVGLVGVGQEEEVMHIPVDNRLDEITNGCPCCNRIGVVVGCMIGDCVICLQDYGEDAGTIVLATLQSLARKNELSLYACR